MKKKQKDPLQEFWKSYVEGDMINRDKLLKSMVQFPIWKELLSMNKIKAKKIDGLTVQEYCLKTHLMSYFDDLIDYMLLRKK